MSGNGYLQVRAYASNAMIPLKDVAITVLNDGESPIAMRVTNRSGRLDEPITIETPDIAAGLKPNTGKIPYTTVTLRARLAGYEMIEIEKLQIFPDTVTDQNLEMIPLAEFPESWNRSEVFITNSQSL